MHTKEKAAEADRMRDNSYKRGYNALWRQRRVIYLSQHPLCAECAKQGKLSAATIIDHIIPHRGNQQLFWDENNWQPLCKDCHAVKTAKGL